MAILNFPNAAGQPIDGSFTYEDNGVLYSWDGYKWTANSEQAYDDRYVEVTGDTMTGDLTVPSLNGGPLAGLRNQLINSDFRIWQRGGVFSNLTALNSGIEYTADHVYVSTISASSGQIQFDRGTVTGLKGFAGCLQNSTNATAYVSFPVELDRLGGFASPFIVGETYTASWYQTDSSQPGNNLQFKVSSDAGTFTDECIEVGSLVAEPTGVGSWTRYSQSFTMVDPTGAAPTLLALTVLIGAGQSITGAQLEIGPVATPFENRPYGLELSLCQRYYQLISSPGESYTQVIISRNSATAYGSHTPISTMRAAPTADVSGVTNVQKTPGPGGTVSPRTLSCNVKGPNSVPLQWSGYTASSNSNTAFGLFTGAVTLDAEL